jgi:hypothetical protein
MESNKPCSIEDEPEKHGINWREVAIKAGVKFLGRSLCVRCLLCKYYPRCDVTLVIENKQLRVECPHELCNGDRWRTNFALAEASAEAVRAARTEGPTSAGSGGVK